MIRPATLDDIPALRELLLFAWGDQAKALPGFNEDWTRNMVKELIKSEEGFARVAEQDGKLIGVILGGLAMTWWSPKAQAQTVLVYVLPTHRGRLGLQLIKAFTDWAEAQGALRVVLNVSAGSSTERSAKLFERLGFTPEGAVFVRG